MAQQAAAGAIDLALRDYFPDALGQFLQRNLPQTGSVELVSIVLLLFTANGIFEPLEVGLNRVWGIRKNRSFFRNQIVSLGLIFICGGLALGSMLLTALNQQSFHVNGYGNSWIQRPGGGKRGMGFACVLQAGCGTAGGAGAVPGLSLFAERADAAQARLPAAIFVGLLMEVLKYVNTLVWPGFQRKLAREYGVFQYSVTLIFLGFLASMLVLGGAEWAARGHRLDEGAEMAPHD